MKGTTHETSPRHPDCHRRLPTLLRGSLPGGSHDGRRGAAPRAGRAAARDPNGRVVWINAMIGIQAIDWLATLRYLFAGTLSLAQVTTAAVAPPLFILALLAFHPRRRRAAPRAGRPATGRS